MYGFDSRLNAAGPGAEGAGGVGGGNGNSKCETPAESVAPLRQRSTCSMQDASKKPRVAIAATKPSIDSTIQSIDPSPPQSHAAARLPGPGCVHCGCGAIDQRTNAPALLASWLVPCPPVLCIFPAPAHQQPNQTQRNSAHRPHGGCEERGVFGRGAAGI